MRMSREVEEGTLLGKKDPTKPGKTETTLTKPWMASIGMETFIRNTDGSMVKETVTKPIIGMTKNTMSSNVIDGSMVTRLLMKLVILLAKTERW